MSCDRRGFPCSSGIMQASMQAYYVYESQLSVREDRHNEFKGHKNIAEKDVPPWCKIPNSTRSSQTGASKALCGFLNTGEGGRVYMGVLDSGVVVGLQMTSSQVQHLEQDTHDMMSRYRPPVSRDRYTLELIPVISTSCSVEDGLQQHREMEARTSAALKEYDSGVQRSHLLRPVFSGGTRHCYEMCWCEKEAQHLKNEGIPLPRYVVHITVLPFQPPCGVGPAHLQLHPIHENEEGVAYIRMTSSVTQMSYQDIVELTKQQISSHFAAMS